MNKENNQEEQNLINDQIISSDDSYEPEQFEDENSSDGLLTGAKYDVPDSKEGFVNTGDGSIINKADLTPFQIIKAIAKENGSIIKNPQKGCNFCYGRGYESLDSKTKMPIPCKCLFRGKTKIEKENEKLKDIASNQMPIPRKQKRKMQKLLLKNFKIQKKFLQQRLADGKEIVETDENTEIKQDNNQEINLVLKQYIQLNSIKKTAETLKLTLTKTKHIIKENKEKLKELMEFIK